MIFNDKPTGPLFLFSLKICKKVCIWKLCIFIHDIQRNKSYIVGCWLALSVAARYTRRKSHSARSLPVWETGTRFKEFKMHFKFWISLVLVTYKKIPVFFSLFYSVLSPQHQKIWISRKIFFFHSLCYHFMCAKSIYKYIYN